LVKEVLQINFTCFQAMKAKTNMRKIISEALTSSVNNNNVSGELCSVLQGLRNNPGENTQVLQNVELLDSIIDLLFSGSQTVISAGFSLAHNLCKRPDIRERLMVDISNQRLSDTDEPVTANDLKEMPYVDAVVKETLRMLPPVGGAYRTATETFQLDVSNRYLFCTNILFFPVCFRIGKLTV
jgi:cytochrome P450